MTQENLLEYVDHTLLKPFCTWDAIKQLCSEALEFDTASVCIPPCYIKRVCDEFDGRVNICTVIGFPLGYSCTAAKLEEARCALADGANEIDMVINITDVKNNNFDAVEAEIAAIKKVCGEKILKVIIETCYLTEEEKIKLCHAVSVAGADYIKTSTGFGTNGATLEDIKLFSENIAPNVKIKAAGGVKSLDDIRAFVDAGCSRIGTSSAVELVKGNIAKGY